MLIFESSFSKVDTSANLELLESTFSILKDEMTSDTVGYYNLPNNSQAMISDLEILDTSKFEQIVVVGIGGSSLGIKAIDSILTPVTPNKKEMIFFENSDPLTISENMARINSQKACFFIISKSGSTIETTSIFKTLISHFKLELDNAKNIFVVTDNNSSLSLFAKSHNIKEFNIPDNVGGRFSVLSAVGIAPLYIAGYDVSSILQGAEDFLSRFFKREEEHLLHKAYDIYAYSGTKSINVLFSYADRLDNFTKWYVQLWGESLGKRDNKGNRVGVTPIGIIGSVDQHSFLQLVIEGPEDKTITFIKIEDFNNDLVIPDVTLEGIEKTNFINGKTFNTLINEQCQATMQSVIESNVSADLITLDYISAENIGAMIIYYELLTSLVGSMLQINTYNQPGVELGKQILYKNLGH